MTDSFNNYNNDRQLLFSLLLLQCQSEVPIPSLRFPRRHSRSFQKHTPLSLSRTTPIHSRVGFLHQIPRSPYRKVYIIYIPRLQLKNHFKNRKRSFNFFVFFASTDVFSLYLSEKIRLHGLNKNGQYQVTMEVLQEWCA